MKVGLPRALLYYWFGPAWKVFLSELGQETITSPPTNKAILDNGVKAMVDEACLPVKIFLGHALFLAGRCEGILLPQIVSVEKNEYICPKFMGLVDMTRQTIKESPLFIWRSDRGSPWDTLSSLPKEMSFLAGRNKVKKAIKTARLAYDLYRKKLWQGFLPSEAEEIFEGKTLAVTNDTSLSPHTIGVIGHPYCLYDSFFNLNLLERLQKENFSVLTPEMLKEEEIAAETNLSKPIFWTLGKRILGSARVFCKRGVKGLIHVTAMACGPESLIGELVRRESHRRRLPLLQLYLDEHSGEAGLATRVEAFLDLLTRKGRIGCV